MNAFGHSPAAGGTALPPAFAEHGQHADEEAARRRRGLTGARILVVEDEYLLADELTRSLEGVGATVLGPAPSVGEALERIDGADRIDGAILDVSLRGEMVFPVAEALARRGTPFVFATGFDTALIPGKFSGVRRYGKPIDPCFVAVSLLA